MSNIFKMSDDILHDYHAVKHFLQESLKRKKSTKEEMKEHLKAIIRHNSLHEDLQIEEIPQRLFCHPLFVSILRTLQQIFKIWTAC